MVSFADAKLASFLVTCTPAAVPTHFVGRTIICPGPGCTLCGFERPRVKHYVLGVVCRQEQLIEMCRSLYDCALEAFRSAVAADWPGVIVRATRTSPRRSWSLQACEFRPELVAQMPEGRHLVRWLGDLYRLPDGGDQETLGQWIRRAGAAHAHLHARALLPGMA